MSVRVHLPSTLQALYQTQPIKEITADSVSAMPRALNQRFPGIGDRLLEPDGSLRRYVNVFVEGDDGRWQAAANSPIQDGKQVWIVGNIAGGLSRWPRPRPPPNPSRGGRGGWGCGYRESSRRCAP